MLTDDEYLERLVAGIHAATSGDADVRWNEKINGRQFDVVVRFRLGTLNFLVLIEVKNRKRPASASDVEAFVVKARDQGANKAVFVTVAGFQAGAKEVAIRHGVDLYTVAFDKAELTIPSAASMIFINNPKAPPGMQPEFSIGEPQLIANIDSLEIHYASGARAKVPSEQSQMNYYMGRTRIGDGRTLNDVVEGYPVDALEEGERLTFREKFAPTTDLSPPDDYFFPKGRVKALSWEVVGVMGRMMVGNILVDPALFVAPVIYTNVMTDEVMTFTQDQLPLGDGDVRPGRYYFIYHPLIYYRCEAIEGDVIRWTIVESFQSGQLQRARFTQDRAWARSYIPVTDKAVITRLKKRLVDYEALLARDVV